MQVKHRYRARNSKYEIEVEFKMKANIYLQLNSVTPK